MCTPDAKGPIMDGSKSTRVPTWSAVVIIVVLLLALATVMVPDLGPEAARAWERTARPALEQCLESAPPVLPASSFGDPYYEWSRLARPVSREADSPGHSVRVAERSHSSARPQTHPNPAK